jgi:probable rRNA maturation factor
MPLIELNASSRWHDKRDWKKICEDSARAAFSVSSYNRLLTKDFVPEVSIKMSDSEEVQQLNKSYRGKDRPTNVLSFPLMDQSMLDTLLHNMDGEILLGDIILAKTVCEEEAEEKQISLENHVTHLIVHGTLHLLGYDHQENAEALLMEELEVKALQTLGIANPYFEESVKR